MKTCQIDFQSTLSLASVAGGFRQAMHNPPFMVKQRYSVEIGQEESMGGVGVDSSGFALEMHADFIADALKVMPGFASSLPGAPTGGLVLQVDEAEDGMVLGTVAAYGSNRTVLKDARRALHHVMEALSSRDSTLQVSEELTGRL